MVRRSESLVRRRRHMTNSGLYRELHPQMVMERLSEIQLSSASSFVCPTGLKMAQIVVKTEYRTVNGDLAMPVEVAS